MKIALKFLLGFLVAAALIGVVGLASVEISKGILQDEIISRLEITSQSRANHIDSLVLERLNNGPSKELSEDTSIREMLRDTRFHPNHQQNVGKVNDRIEELVSANKEVYKVLVIDKDGIVVASNFNEEVGLNMSNDENFLNGKYENYLRGVHYIAGNDNPGIDVVSPVVYEGRFMGIVVSHINMDLFYSVLADETGIGDAGEVYLVNSEGLLVSPSKYSEDEILDVKVDTVNSRYCIEKYIRGDLDAEIIQEDMAFINYMNDTVIGTNRYISSAGWCLLTEVNQEESLKAFETLRENILVVTYTVIGLSLIVAFLMSYTITKPLRHLTRGVEVIGKGNLDHKIHVKSRDEVGNLTKAFNKMAGDLRNYEEEMVKSERLATIGKLAGIMGHEIRNPLGVIRNSVYFMNMKLGKDTDEKVKKHLGIVDNEIDNANKIINDVLDFARIKPPSLEKIQVNNLVKEIVEKFTIPDNVKVTTSLAKDLPETLIDPVQVMQVFTNMLSNAVQAMTEGGKLEIITKKEDNFISTIFQDNGPGITEENIKKIFEPLFSTKAKGVGLGLATCFNIIEGHKGKIDVESEVGKGTTFTIKLPLK